METTKPLTIFLVDDDPFCGRMYEQHVRNLGHTNVTLFNDGQDCLNRLTEQPDIIFLDYHMEPMDGLEVLRKIKRFSPDIFLVIVSGQEDLNVAVNALKYGAFDYIIKGDNDFEKITSVLTKIQDVMEMLKQRPPGKMQKLFSLLGVA
ncbi:response regulator [Fibrivirga algicola]|uniref:Response regulator n=1 Tax=Fibrivirga algicola TaxID=2950420 RepID=A0ABX0QFB6_9BACT|nr:response regulator [Fibrivirga algicola]ARK10854.1 histidine kinase [Fibrella sp. ES10-3-2-2]NID09900.1 response regulator [Fibrivirga algicola]